MSAAARRRSVLDALADRWRERRAYRGLRSWPTAVYNRLLLRFSGVPLPGRRRVTRVLLRDEPAPVFVRLGTSDLLVLEEMYIAREYAPVAEGLGEVRTIVDLGANIGLSVRLWRRWFPSARVVAVEPDEGNLSMCRRNVPEEGVRWVRACAAGHTREVVLDRSPMDWAFCMREKGGPSGSGAPGRETIVPALSMPDLLRGAGVEGSVDLLKCDIEGAEAELFAACGEWIGRVRHIVVEVHAPYGEAALRRDLGSSEPCFDFRRIKDAGTVQVLLLTRRGTDTVPAVRVS